MYKDSRNMFIQAKIRWYNGKEFDCQCKRLRRLGFSSWVQQIPWSGKWQPTLVFWSGKFHGQRSLAGYSPWGCKESDTTEGLSLSADREDAGSIPGLERCPREGNCYPLQYSGLENSIDCIVHWVSKSQT